MLRVKLSRTIDFLVVCRQVTSSLTAARTTERSLWIQEKLELQESLRAATQAADKEKEEISKVRSALDQDVKETEQSQSQWKRDKTRLLEEHLQVTSSLSAGLIKSLEELEADRSLRNQENVEFQESIRAATQAVDQEKEAGKKPKKKSVQTIPQVPVQLWNDLPSSSLRGCMFFQCSPGVN
ncbi:unnamed protein product [Pleuronectes platessa]|uniref:Uncharacterized protein n=1 Tax=Pleuronectes platessa TaxID=8262 RepID=A0A9N7Z3L8_PLEPL|nr:unnamed protein product [Pleuronectes platessa]